jgi:hypothetical protein
MDASDLLSCGEGSEDSIGGREEEDYFAVSLSDSEDSDNTRARTSPSPVDLLPGSQLVQEVHGLDLDATSRSLEKDLSCHGVTSGGNSTQCGGFGGNGSATVLEPVMEDQQGDLGFPQAQAHETAMQSLEGEELSRIKAFCAHMLKTLAPPLLREVESTNKLRADAEPFTPRRMTRRSSSAASAAPAPTPAKATRKASVAETVLLKALGFTAMDLEATDEDLLAFKRMFDSPVCDQQLRIMAALFGKTMPAAGQEVQGGPAEIRAH